jgi:hypothetical protein
MRLFFARGAVLGIGLLILTACCTRSESTARYDLPSGSSISLSISADDTSEITATIPPGHAGSGTWVSHNERLLAAARLAMNHLNEPGVIVSIEVTGREIVAISASTPVR